MSAQAFHVRETPARGETSARGGRNTPGQVDRRPDAEEQSVRLCHVRGLAVVQSCLFEAESYNRVLKNQWLASLNVPVLGNLHHSRRKHRAIQGDGWLSNPIFESFEDIVGHCYFAWNKLIDMPWKIISIGTMDPDQAISY